MKRKKTKQNSEMEEQEVQATQQSDTQTEVVENNCCKEQIELMSDKYLRLLAEFENFKRRTLKEKEDLYKTASARIITAILPVLDDIDRALLTVIPGEETKALIEGFDLISKKFKTILKQYGLEPIEALNQEFNTDYHEALTIVEVEKQKKGKVIEEIEKGYLLDGHVIRFSKVIVGK